eukprot:TRINITY_DN6916_c0_g1_i1.p2 TRINITY_DN6916_c0_g1~~TRINITY_DN6916_c0_g1_i1.p2  ORF type:complete len:313 (-),score=-22.54 TRINITY_DN6916_c0_g1_i1:1657-2595(-)
MTSDENCAKKLTNQKKNTMEINVIKKLIIYECFITLQKTYFFIVLYNYFINITLQGLPLLKKGKPYKVIFIKQLQSTIKKYVFCSVMKHSQIISFLITFISIVFFFWLVSFFAQFSSLVILGQSRRYHQISIDQSSLQRGTHILVFLSKQTCIIQTNNYYVHFIMVSNNIFICILYYNLVIMKVFLIFKNIFVQQYTTLADNLSEEKKAVFVFSIYNELVNITICFWLLCLYPFFFILFFVKDNLRHFSYYFFNGFLLGCRNQNFRVGSFVILPASGVYGLVIIIFWDKKQLQFFLFLVIQYKFRMQNMQGI